jgi:hypothetical protein
LAFSTNCKKQINVLFIAELSCVAAIKMSLAFLFSTHSKWQMAFNVDKCHLLSSHQEAEASAHHLLAPWGPRSMIMRCNKYPAPSTSAWKYLRPCTGGNTSRQLLRPRADRSCAFACRNLKGCPTQVQVYCYKALLRPVLAYASAVWDPH